ncbi:prepilin-type N-terminal cleavage/methylation domain-containing protein [Aliivibrio finisterrensis]|uniref:Prepilin-type N-terminal cleavage/methylation domain-containing protein n=1 Tax=Aliivibrio finisterrensis TaxID=511998 RepID=A0A4Q5KH94_9GAMM|nr:MULTISPECIES: prepilin-type N-terminal cleavage/methylation domain-containing protein [Aliivibrio]MDD9176883.1 prepilin-type N-terminal cleavage/methylation domain-containing protein [Aliivibrio sp. S3TY1]MDD9194036.1 prepilin-type N-terminal cleavage/methylation domain-containing protein [Aliivibrio sp. S2TY2]RYU44545.1 prepilin-type N-terminal cleavage/methylation domain-containing protein [Aliivibrio finisterrensis]
MISKQKGFSLLEIMISFTIIGIGALGLLKLQTFIELKSEYATRSIEALYNAETQLEKFRSRSTSGAGGTITYNSINTSSDEITTNGVTYTLAWNVDNIISASAKHITISSAWDTRHGNKEFVTLETIISKYNEFD